MIKKRNILIGTLAICTIGALTFKEETKLNKEIISNDRTIAMYKTDDGTNYTEITEIPDKGYTINEEKSYCTTDNKTQVKGKVKTIDGNHTITNLAKSDKCYLWFDKEKEPTAGDSILGNITVNENTPDFSQVATTDEGVFKVEDPIYNGTSYYWRGAVTNNYVKFAGLCWRIIRINGDGSIRLIYDGTTCHANGTVTAESVAVASTKYNTSYNNSSYVGWTYTVNRQRPVDNNTGTASNAKTQLENWYTSNLGSYAEYIADGKYCNDRNVKSGQTWTGIGTSFQYAAYQRLGENKTPTLNCPSEDVYTLKVGLITADEVSYAGGVWNTNNTSYYLYNGQYYWTMSPNQWFGVGSGSRAYVSYVHNKGHFNANNADSAFGLRPVINLKSNTMFVAGGDGTQNKPYVVQ